MRIRQAPNRRAIILTADGMIQKNLLQILDDLGRRIFKALHGQNNFIDFRIPQPKRKVPQLVAIPTAIIRSLPATPIKLSDAVGTLKHQKARRKGRNRWF